MWCRKGEGWIVGLDASRTFVRDSKGMTHLAHLLTRPGEEASALDLVAAEEGTPVAGAEDAGPQLDAAAKAEYRQRMEALAEQIRQAERAGDAARSEQASTEFEFLARELQGAVGLGGRDRKVASNVERARVNVTRSIRSAIDRIARQDEALAVHLRACVRTGAFCAYEPHRDIPVSWSHEAEPAAASIAEQAPPRAAGPVDASVTDELSVMFMDIEDSTVLMERLGERNWLDLLSVHDGIVRSALETHGGSEVKSMGDGFMLTFEDPQHAVWCAVDVQRELDVHTRRDPSRPLRVRIGVHHGSATRERDDVFGRTVVVAARLCQQARGGQIVISDAVRERLGDLAEVGVESMQVVRLRGLRGRHRVHELVWQRDAAGRGSPVQAAAADPLDRLLDRDAELEALRDAARAARDGSGGVVMIEGPAGIGKSSLLLHLLDDVEADGMLALRARATRLESDVAFGAARRLFEPALRGVDPERLERLVSGPVRPAAAMLGHGGDEAEGFFGESGAMHILNGLFWLAAGLAEERPVVIALDDAHWADPQTLEWIEHAADRLADVSVLLVVSARAGAEAAHLAGVRGAATRVITPRPLSESAAVGAVRAAWPEATVRFARACHETSGGNPFYLREILVAAQAAGIEPTDEGVTRLPEATPDSVARTVLARIAQQGEAARAVARALAVLGGRGEMSLVADIAGLDAAAAFTAVDALDRADVVDGAATLTFTHPLIGAVVERDLRAGERALLHERAAALLYQRQAPPDLVAVHLLHARPGGVAGAVETLRAAARAATRDGVPTSAARLLERALAEPPTPQALPLVLLELGRALQGCGSGAQAASHLERAMTVTTSHRLRAEILIALSAIHERRDAGLRVRQIDELVAQLDEEDRDLRFALEARAVELLGDLMMETPSPQIRQAHDERLRRVLEETPGGSAGERQLIVISAVHQAIRAAIPADEAQALALRALDDGSLPRLMAAGAWWADSAIEVLSMTDAFEEADHHARAAERAAREAGAVTAEAWACLVRAMVALHRGALPDCEALLRSVFGITRQPTWSLPKYIEYGAQQVRASCAIERGDLETASRAAEALARDAVRPWAVPVVMGRLHAARGEHDLAVGSLSSALEMHRAGSIWRTTALGSPGPDLALSLVALGRHDEALAVAREELTTARRFGSASSVGTALRALAHTDDPARTVEHLTEAAEVLSASQALLARGHVLCDLGSARRVAGDLLGTGHALRQAFELGTRCGSRRLAERARGEMALAGLRPPVVQVTPSQLLLPAERRAAELAAEGAEDREIAQALFLSPRVVAEQLAVAIGKLRLSSRAELAHAMQERRELVG